MRITPLVASTFASDGGAMFGIVPKTIWSKLLRPDRANAVPQHAHCLLLELDDGRVGLVDTGCGAAELYSAKEQRYHQLGDGWPLAAALARAAVALESIDFVVLTHLHWDHAGGVRRSEGGRPAGLAFPRALHFVHEREWQDATSGDELLHKAYPPELLEPLRASGERLKLAACDESEVLPGVWMVRSGGHTAGHCVVVLRGPDLILDHPAADRIGTPGRCVFAGDVCPTQHHLRMVFQTAYDCFPLETRAWKRRWLASIARDGDLLLFDHDPDLFGATLRPDERRQFVPDRLLATAAGAGPGASRR